MHRRSGHVSQLGRSLRGREFMTSPRSTRAADQRDVRSSDLRRHPAGNSGSPKPTSEASLRIHGSIGDAAVDRLARSPRAFSPESGAQIRSWRRASLATSRSWSIWSRCLGPPEGIGRLLQRTDFGARYFHTDPEAVWEKRIRSLIRPSICGPQDSPWRSRFLGAYHDRLARPKVSLSRRLRERRTAAITRTGRASPTRPMRTRRPPRLQLEASLL